MAKALKLAPVTADVPGNRETADAPRHLSKQEFGKRLSRLMVEKGYHHAELARRAGLPRNNISTYVNGRSYPSQQSLAAIARVLGVEPDELLPNRLEMAIRGEQMPDLSMKTAFGDPARSWL